MREALRQARKGLGRTSPNPAVGAVVVRRGQCLGKGWHKRAGNPHAEIESFQDAQQRGHRLEGADLFVTLEPCSTHGRTPPCVDAILKARLRRVVVGTTDPNPAHQGQGLRHLESNGLTVIHGVLEHECRRLIEAFQCFITRKQPWVIVKAGMTLDGKIATQQGESQWITSPQSRNDAMKWRWQSDGIVVGAETVLRDDPELSLRGPGPKWKKNSWRRFVLDTHARTPPSARLLNPNLHGTSTIVVGASAPKSRVSKLCHAANVWVLPEKDKRIDLRHFLRKLGSENITQLLVEGGGEVQASFLLARLAHRVLFYYATQVLGGINSRRAVSGKGATNRHESIHLHDVQWRRIGPDLRMTALTTHRPK